MNVVANARNTFQFKKSTTNADVRAVKRSAHFLGYESSYRMRVESAHPHGKNFSIRQHKIMSNGDWVVRAIYGRSNYL
jgi:hypothetical protein